MNTMSSPELLTIPEAGKYLRVHPQTIRRWLITGELRGSKLGGAWRITQAAVREFLKDGEPEKRSEPVKIPDDRPHVIDESNFSPTALRLGRA